MFIHRTACPYGDYTCLSKLGCSTLYYQVLTFNLSVWCPCLGIYICSVKGRLFGIKWASGTPMKTLSTVLYTDLGDANTVVLIGTILNADQWLHKPCHSPSIPHLSGAGLIWSWESEMYCVNNRICVIKEFGIWYKHGECTACSRVYLDVKADRLNKCLSIAVFHPYIDQF